MNTVLQTVVCLILINGVFSQTIFITTKDVNLYLYTRMNLEKPEKIRTADLSDIFDSNYNSSKPNYFVIHGIYCSHLYSFYAKDPLLQKTDSNVFLVDYSGPASVFEIHDEAIVATGKILADFIREMKITFHLFANSFTLIGQSMGAHVAGEVGRNLNGQIGIIVALDPPNMDPPIVYIDHQKAHHVQSIRTSLIGLSMVGHANFIANTFYQPGCYNNTGCSHFTASLYYEESLLTGGFTALKCDSYESFVNGYCDQNEKSHFGHIEIDTKANGSYYLITNGKSPYSVG